MSEENHVETAPSSNICQIPECSFLIHARRMCRRHYYQWIRANPKGARPDPLFRFPVPVNTETKMWAPIPETDLDYYASTLGEIYSRITGKILQSSVYGPRGHVGVHLGRTKRNAVHRLVLLAHIGGPLEGQECRHLNGDPKDNRLENLTWGTAAENMADRVLHGTSNRGERNGMRKLTLEEVRLIKTSKEPNETLAKKYNVLPAAIRRIKSGARWGHI